MSGCCHRGNGVGGGRRFGDNTQQLARGTNACAGAGSGGCPGRRAISRTASDGAAFGPALDKRRHHQPGPRGQQTARRDSSSHRQPEPTLGSARSPGHPSRPVPGGQGERGEPRRWPWLSAEPWAPRLQGAGAGGPGRILVWWGDASTHRARGGRWQGRKTDTFLNEAPSFSREKGSGVTPRGQLG